jgi:hypothetical protein
MVADMADFSRSWKELCGRLGVQPKQFATLLAVMVVAVGGLGIKMAAGGPRKAAAASTTRAKPAKTAPAPATASTQARVVTGEAQPTQRKSASRRVIEVTLDRDPARDPFRPWGVPEPSEAPAQHAAPVSTIAAPGYLPGVVLKAVVPGELAVFGDQTVRQGDAVALPDGTFARVTAIRSRTVTVDWNGRPLDVNFGSAPQPKNPAPGGFR